MKAAFKVIKTTSLTKILLVHIINNTEPTESFIMVQKKLLQSLLIFLLLLLL